MDKRFELERLRKFVKLTKPRNQACCAVMAPRRSKGQLSKNALAVVGRQKAALALEEIVQFEVDFCRRPSRVPARSSQETLARILSRAIEFRRSSATETITQEELAGYAELLRLDVRDPSTISHWLKAGDGLDKNTGRKLLSVVLLGIIPPDVQGAQAPTHGEHRTPATEKTLGAANRVLAYFFDGREDGPLKDASYFDLWEARWPTCRREMVAELRAAIHEASAKGRITRVSGCLSFSGLANEELIDGLYRGIDIVYCVPAEGFGSIPQDDEGIGASFHNLAEAARSRTETAGSSPTGKLFRVSVDPTSRKKSATLERWGGEFLSRTQRYTLVDIAPNRRLFVARRSEHGPCAHEGDTYEQALFLEWMSLFVEPRIGSDSEVNLSRPDARVEAPVRKRSERRTQRR